MCVCVGGGGRLADSASCVVGAMDICIGPWWGLLADSVYWRGGGGGCF